MVCFFRVLLLLYRYWEEGVNPSLHLYTSAHKNTGVLIEYPKFHQHSDGLTTLIKFRLAKERDLQLSITTHSVEPINIVKRLAEELGLGIKVFYLERGHSSSVVGVRVLKSGDLEVLKRIGLDPNIV